MANTKTAKDTGRQSVKKTASSSAKSGAKEKNSKDRYVAYVGTYTHTKSIGIYIYDVNTDTGVLTEREGKATPVNNPSHLTLSKDGHFLYSIAEEGVVAFSIDDDGNLTKINQAWIGGMRGCYISVDSRRRFLFIGGYHDGRVTVMKLNPDGSIGDIACGIYHQGVALSSTERRLDHPKVTSVTLSPDEKYLFASDLGLNQIKVYLIDYVTGQLKLLDIIRNALDAGPRALRFSADGRFLYVLTQLNNSVEVYSYDDVDDEPLTRKIQTISVLDEKYPTAESCSLRLTEDGSYLMVTIDSLNEVSFLKRNPMDGTLRYAWGTPTSGDFPKALGAIPGNRYYIALNHDANEMRTFKIHYQDGYALGINRPISINKPNCIQFLNLKDRK